VTCYCTLLFEDLLSKDLLYVVVIAEGKGLYIVSSTILALLTTKATSGESTGVTVSYNVSHVQYAKYYLEIIIIVG
jgi:hypothetical protein